MACPAEHPTGISQASDVRFRITPDPLAAARTAAAVSAPDCGAVATFVGLVRDHNIGRRVLSLEYECYQPLAIKAFRRGLVYDPDHPQLTLLLAQTLLKAEKGEQVAEIFARLGGRPSEVGRHRSCHH